MKDPEAALPDAAFSYLTVKSGKVLISHHGKQVTVLQGTAAAKFVAAIESMDTPAAQRYMAAATGQYKFGNERSTKNAPKRHETI